MLMWLPSCGKVWLHMIDFTGRQLEEITGGTLSGFEQDRVVGVPGFYVDSRTPIHNGVFVALVGERVDGHEYLDSVKASGAVLAIVKIDSAQQIPEGLPVLRVSDPLVALGQIAHWVRVNIFSARVIGITGSSGKTSTKDLIAGILGQFGETVAPPGSFNTEVGLPLTILSADSRTQFLVLEMGMRGIGHIAALAEIAEPDIGVVINVGSAHIELLGSMENIALAKGELIRALPVSGMAILNLDDPLVAKMSESLDCVTFTFGETRGSDFQASDIKIEADGTTSFMITHEGKSCAAHVKLIGLHYVSNALAAVSTCVAAGVPFETACTFLGNVSVISKWRMEVLEAANGVTVINDSYNANPESTRAALKALAQLGTGESRRRTWAILGEMRELGEHSLEAHDAIGRLAVRLDISRLVCVGAGTKVMHLAAANEGSWGEESVWVADIDEAMTLLAGELTPGDIVLVKASRSIGLDRVASEIQTLPLSNVTEDFDVETDREQGAP
jgi:UDP-N-acetylmuramoyl-tripeptide--D-alanyl-D-alanine ligase